VGTLRSKSIKACVKEYDKYLRKGYRRIVLLSDNLGAYGFDIESSFAALLNNLAAISAKEVHWYLQELHPRWVILYRAALLNFAEEQRIQEILCAIQSGSNRILKLMNRHHSIEEIRDVLLQLRIVNPNVKLYTQVIVGFPSETEEDFLATLMVLKEIRFDQVTLYPYYDGYDTIASKMDGKIDEITMSRRLKAGMEYLKQEKIDAWCDNADVDSANMLLLKRND
jgi:tRNA A37 methylthiotransferase MiaB